VRNGAAGLRWVAMGPGEQVLAWAIEPVEAVIPVEVQISPTTDLYFEIIGVEDLEGELVITI